jgi:GNAT superfamily N-acetyltransferase
MLAPSISTVRLAGPPDYEEIWRLFLQGHHENGIFSLSPVKVQWFINRALFPQAIPFGDTGTRGVIGVIGPVGHLEGLVFVTIGEYWYSEEKHLEEFLVYVDPEYRKSDHAAALIKWMKDQSETTGLPLMTGVISNYRTEAKCRLYRRSLPKMGEFFFYPPKGYTTAAAARSSSPH